MSSTLKAVEMGTSMRKADRKDDHPPKKASVTVGDKSLKKPMPPKPSHGTGKGLMTTLGPVAQGSNCLLHTHKDYAIEMHHQGQGYRPLC